jgi:LmbE family N-acetylglucosaminyl deacetylase
MTPKKILAIGGHPDDVEQFMGGTLLLLTKAGHEITVAAMTDGACGSHEVSAEEIVKTRHEESENAAKLLGVKKFINLGIRDGSIEYNLENVKKVVALIRDVNPDIILTHPGKDDYMTDHWHTGALVLWAVPEATHENFDSPTNSPAIKDYPAVYHCDPQGLTDAEGQVPHVNTIVDISSSIDEKMKAFAAHASQMNFMDSQQGKKDAIYKTKRWDIIRGEQINVEFGEGFNQQLNAEYPKQNLLKELLAEKVFTL